MTEDRTPTSLAATLDTWRTPPDRRPLAGDPDARLHTEHGPGSTTGARLKAGREVGVPEGWPCNREHGGFGQGRLLEPHDDRHRLSVDVAGMDDVAQPRHTRPTGEVDLIVPVEGDARFDGAAVRLACPAPGAHRPTPSGGRAPIPNLLPNGGIGLTR